MPKETNTRKRKYRTRARTQVVLGFFARVSVSMGEILHQGSTSFHSDHSHYTYYARMIWPQVSSPVRLWASWRRDTVTYSSLCPQVLSAQGPERNPFKWCLMNQIEVWKRFGTWHANSLGILVWILLVRNKVLGRGIDGLLWTHYWKERKEVQLWISAKGFLRVVLICCHIFLPQNLCPWKALKHPNH